MTVAKLVEFLMTHCDADASVTIDNSEAEYGPVEITEIHTIQLPNDICEVRIGDLRKWERRYVMKEWKA